MLEKALELIREQRKKEGSLEYGIAGMLEEICRANADAAELIAQDLSITEMNLEACGKKLFDYARNNKSGSYYAMTPSTAVRLIADFYKIPKEMLPKGYAVSEQDDAPEPTSTNNAHIDLFDLLD